MYFEVDINNISMLVLEESDICNSCVKKFDCALICGLTSGFVALTNDDEVLSECNDYKGE